MPLKDVSRAVVKSALTVKHVIYPAACLDRPVSKYVYALAVLLPSQLVYLTHVVVSILVFLQFPRRFENSLVIGLIAD
jgi:hypothetical protein